MYIKEPKIIERITDNFWMALFVGLALMFIARYIGSQEGLLVLGMTLRAMIELTGFYLLIRGILKLNKKMRERKKQSVVKNSE